MRQRSVTRGTVASRTGARKRPAVESTVADRLWSEDSLSRLFDHSPVGLAVTDRNFRFLRCSPSLCRFLGYDESAMLGRTFVEYTHPDDLAIGRSELQEMLAGARETADVEKRYIRADGATVWGRVTVSAVPGSDGQVVYFMSAIQDITRRKTAEADERLAGQRRDLHVSHTPLGVVEFTVDGRISAWNAAAADIFGYTEHEAVGRHWTLIVPEEARGRVDGVWEALVSQRGGSRSSNLNRHKSGRLIQCEWFNTPLRAADGKTLGVASLVMDITERLRAQEELARHRDHLEELVRARTIELETSRDQLTEAQRIARLGNWEWDIAADAVSGSPEFYRLFDSEPARLVRFSDFAGALHPDDLERVNQAVADALAQRRMYQTDYRVKLRDGQWRHIAARGGVSCDEQAQPVRMVGTCMDVTEEKQREHALRRLTDDLARSNKELEQFAYVASHDLQEPLRMVSSFTQLLADRYGDKLDQDAREFIAYAVDGARRMQRLIQDLLLYSRVSTRGQRMGPLDAHDPLGDAVHNLQAAIEEAGALVTNDELPQVWGDQTQIAQVFQNLIGNALKYRRPEEAPRVHVSARRDPDRAGLWTFSVGDNGIGIEQRHFGRLFVIFQRLHGRAEYPGTGVGLALCKRIVERHGGAIWLESEPGQGTTFFFTLPPGHPDERPHP